MPRRLQTNLFRRRLISVVFILLGLIVNVDGAHADSKEGFRHALIIGVAVYRDRSIPPLFGVPNDMDSAREMAMAMGIPKEQITELFNAEATKDGIIAALRSLAGKNRAGGRVLVYFSGHGTRWRDQTSGGCVEGLLTWDRKVIVNREFSELARPLGLKTDKLIIMFDACHSGGVMSATRGLGKTPDTLQPKFVLVKSDQTGAACSQAANIKSRSLLGIADDGVPPLPENVVHITTARPNEVSFDEPGKGGLGTQAVKQCMLGGARDLDGSGAVTLNEIEQCAQEIIAKKLIRYPDLLPHHVTIRGLRNLIPVAATTHPTNDVVNDASGDGISANEEKIRTERYRAEALAVALREEERQARMRIEAERQLLALESTQSQLRPSETLAGLTAAQQSALAEATALVKTEAEKPVTAIAALHDIHEQRDRQIDIQFDASASKLKIGVDDLRLRLGSSIDGYVYLFILGSDGEKFYLLFPNALDKDNAIRAGQSLSLPRQHWSIRALGPAGADRVLAVVSQTPLDLKKLNLSPNDPENPFSFQSARLDGRRNLVNAIIAESFAGSGYGSALLTVEESP